MTPVKNNPNAAVAGGSSLISAGLVWAAGQAGVDVTPEAAVIFTGAFSTTWLFIGRNGLKGAFRRVWNGLPGTGSDSERKS